MEAQTQKARLSGDSGGSFDLLKLPKPGSNPSRHAGMAEDFGTTIQPKSSKFKPATSNKTLNARKPPLNAPTTSRAPLCNPDAQDESPDELDTLSSPPGRVSRRSYDTSPSPPVKKRSSQPSRTNSSQEHPEDPRFPDKRPIYKTLKMQKTKRTPDADKNMGDDDARPDDELRLSSPAKPSSQALSRTATASNSSTLALAPFPLQTSTPNDPPSHSMDITTPKPVNAKPRPRPLKRNLNQEPSKSYIEDNSRTPLAKGSTRLSPPPKTDWGSSVEDGKRKGDWTAGGSTTKATKLTKHKTESFPLPSPPKPRRTRTVDTDRDEDAEERRGRTAQVEPRERRARSAATKKTNYAETSSSSEENVVVRRKRRILTSSGKGKESSRPSPSDEASTSVPKKRKGKKPQLEAFPLDDGLLPSAGPESSPASSPLGKRSSSEDGSGMDDRGSKKLRGVDHLLDSPSRDQWEEGYSILSPVADPKTLCPYCDSPLPSSPSPYLQSLFAAILPKSRRDPRPSNPLGRRALLSVYVSACQRHRFESQLLPKAEENGWPKTIEWSKVEARVVKMEATLQKLIAGLNTQETTSSSVRSVFWAEIMEEVRTKGSRAVTGVQGQFVSFEKSRPGYYGELGSMVIHQALYNMFPPENIDPLSIAPLAVNEFFVRVLVPEVATRLIMEDRNLSGERGMAEAIEVLRASSSYGVAMFPEDSGELDGVNVDGARGRRGKRKEGAGAMGVADAMMMERARRRRKELEAEELEDESRQEKRQEAEKKGQQEASELENERENEQKSEWSTKSTRGSSVAPSSSSGQGRSQKSSQPGSADHGPPVTSRPRPRPIEKKTSALNIPTDPEADLFGSNAPRSTQGPDYRPSSRSRSSKPPSRASSRAPSPTIQPAAKPRSRAPSRAPESSTMTRNHSVTRGKPLSDVDTNTDFTRSQASPARSRSRSVARPARTREATIELSLTDEDEDGPRGPSKTPKDAKTRKDALKRTRSARSVDDDAMVIDSESSDGVEIIGSKHPTPKRGRTAKPLDPDATPIARTAPQRPQLWKPETLTTADVSRSQSCTDTTQSPSQKPRRAAASGSKMDKLPEMPPLFRSKQRQAEKTGTTTTTTTGTKRPNAGSSSIRPTLSTMPKLYTQESKDQRTWSKTMRKDPELTDEDDMDSDDPAPSYEPSTRRPKRSPERNSVDSWLFK